MKRVRKKDMQNFNHAVIKLLLLSTALLAFVNELMLAPILTNVAKDMNTDVSNLGFLIGIYGITAGIVAFIIGPVSDKYGRKNTLVLSLSIYFITSMLFSLSWNIHSLYFFRFLNALSAGPLFFCALSYVGDCFSERERGSVTGLVSGAVYLSFVIGVPVGVALMKISDFGWRMPFMIISVMSLICCVGVIKFLPNIAANKSATIKVFIKSYSEVFLNKSLLLFLLIILTIRIGIGMYTTYSYTYFINCRDITLNTFMVVFVIGGMISFLTSAIAGKLSDKYCRKRISIIGSVFIIITLGMLVLVPFPKGVWPYIFTGFCVIYMASESFRVTPLNSEAIIVVRPEIRGVFMGLLAFVTSIGTSIGAFISSAIIKVFKNIYEGGEGYFSIGYEFGVVLVILLWLFAIYLIIKSIEGNKCEISN